jgi:hypothetical protein
MLTPGRQGVAAGTSYIAIKVSLAGADPCLWPKWPATELRDAQGTVIARGAEDGAEVVLVVASLNLELGWSSWCLPPPDAPLMLAVLLPDGEVSTNIPPGFGASCMDVPTAISLQITD